MCLLFETIRLENGVPRHLDWHEQRMNRSRREIWHADDPVILGSLIIVPDEFSAGLVRCNIRYGPGIRRITFKHYQKTMGSLPTPPCQISFSMMEKTGSPRQNPC